jgi:hypothetical protein
MSVCQYVAKPGTSFLRHGILSAWNLAARAAIVPVAMIMVAVVNDVRNGIFHVMHDHGNWLLCGD